MRKNAIAVAIVLGDRLAVEEHLSELALLADTAEINILSQVTQERKQVDSATYLGSGKIAEIAALAEAMDADLLLFDDELSPSQVRNIEEVAKKPVLDRTGLILEIFSGRARSREARVQVELARQQYLLPRLTGLWTHFTRQKGGVGLKGEGESQLEMDRRMTKTRISELRADLERISRQRVTRRRGRDGFFKVSLVGYTNAGKSTLLNALTDAGAYTEDRLFATLDSTTQRLPGRPILVTDTVGFIRKLPHALVASFRSTLSEITEADLLLHVVDVSHPDFEEHIRTTEGVLAEIDAEGVPVLLVLNKSDRLPSDNANRLCQRFPGSLLISAKESAGFPELLNAIELRRREGKNEVTRLFPHTAGNEMERLYREGRVLGVEYVAEGVQVTFLEDEILPSEEDFL